MGETCHRVVMDHHPFDTVGWDGCYYPWAFSIHDFEPIVGRIHQPPPVHQTFEGDGFVICSFVPRLYDFHPRGRAGALQPLQRHDRRGALLLQRRVHEPHRASSTGSITLHPDGLPHGPQPGQDRGVHRRRRRPTSWR